MNDITSYVVDNCLFADLVCGLGPDTNVTLVFDVQL